MESKKKHDNIILTKEMTTATKKTPFLLSTLSRVDVRVMVSGPIKYMAYTLGNLASIVGWCTITQGFKVQK